MQRRKVRARAERKIDAVVVPEAVLRAGDLRRMARHVRARSFGDSAEAEKALKQL